MNLVLHTPNAGLANIPTQYHYKIVNLDDGSEALNSLHIHLADEYSEEVCGTWDADYALELMREGALEEREVGGETPDFTKEFLNATETELYNWFEELNGLFTNTPVEVCFRTED